MSVLLGGCCGSDKPRGWWVKGLNLWQVPWNVAVAYSGQEDWYSQSIIARIATHRLRHPATNHHHDCIVVTHQSPTHPPAPPRFRRWTPGTAPPAPHRPRPHLPTPHGCPPPSQTSPRPSPAIAQAHSHRHVTRSDTCTSPSTQVPCSATQCCLSRSASPDCPRPICAAA